MPPNAFRSVASLAGLLAFCLLFFGCQTPRHKEFARIQDGMNKADVLEAAGNPDRTRRWQGKDRWIYVYQPEDSGVEIKEVHFQEGQVVYRGSPIPPSVSAEEQDRINEESNLALEAKLREERAADRAAVSTGLDAPTVDESLRTAPQYEAID